MDHKIDKNYPCCKDCGLFPNMSAWDYHGTGKRSEVEVQGPRQEESRQAERGQILKEMPKK
jgi:hypothetical protein